jgi:serine protease
MFHCHIRAPDPPRPVFLTAPRLMIPAALCPTPLSQRHPPPYPTPVLPPRPRKAAPHLDSLCNPTARGGGGASCSRRLQGLGMAVVDSPLSALAAATLRSGREDKIAFIEQDFTVKALQSGAPAVTSRAADSTLWHMDRIDQRARTPYDNFYKYRTLGSGATVFILDTGVTATHQEFSNGAGGSRVVEATSYASGTSSAADVDGHGSHCAGLCCGGTIGPASSANIVNYKVLGDDGSGSWSGILSAMNAARTSTRRPAVVSMSLGGGGNSPSSDRAVQQLLEAGVPTVIAAGNENQDACRTTPGGADEAITVGSSNINDGLSDFSNYGRCVDISAPGENIKSVRAGTTSQ